MITEVLDRIEIVVTTVSRGHDYIHELLRLLHTGLRVRLVVGSPDCDYLERYRSDPQVSILEPRLSQWRVFQDAVVHHKACWNYWRTLREGHVNPDTKGCLVLEDDVVPAERWEEQFVQNVRVLESRHDWRFVLALYAPYAFDSAEGVRFVEYPVEDFYGTQAIYYPEKVRHGFSAFLEAQLKEYNIPYDLLLKKYLQLHSLLLFATIPSLFEHIGRHSTGLGHFHSAGIFREKL